MSLSPVPKAKGVDDEVGRMAATELGAVREVVATLLSSSTVEIGCVWYVDVGMKALVNDEEDVGISLYVEAMAALAIACRAMSLLQNLRSQVICHATSSRDHFYFYYLS